MMWIKRKGSDTINLNYVICIEKYIRHKSESNERNYYALIFNYSSKDKASYKFESEEECEEYYDALLNTIGAHEVPLLKIV